MSNRCGTRSSSLLAFEATTKGQAEYSINDILKKWWIPIPGHLICSPFLKRHMDCFFQERNPGQISVWTGKYRQRKWRTFWSLFVPSPMLRLVGLLFIWMVCTTVNAMYQIFGQVPNNHLSMWTLVWSKPFLCFAIY